MEFITNSWIWITVYARFKHRIYRTPKQTVLVSIHMNSMKCVEAKCYSHRWNDVSRVHARWGGEWKDVSIQSWWDAFQCGYYYCFNLLLYAYSCYQWFLRREWIKSVRVVKTDKTSVSMLLKRNCMLKLYYSMESHTSTHSPDSLFRYIWITKRLWNLILWQQQPNKYRIHRHNHCTEYPLETQAHNRCYCTDKMKCTRNRSNDNNA